MRHRRRKQMKHRILAIGLDAADTKLIRLLIDEGEMPVLASLLADGRWIDISSTADVGSSSVWPTFTTSDDPEIHGIYSEWCWEPEAMGLSMLTGRHLNPFWKTLSEKGHSVGVLGVPFMPLVGLSTGFEVSEHPPFVSRSGDQPVVTAARARDALSHGTVKVAGPNDTRNLQKLAADSLTGIRLRSELAEQLISKTQPDVSIVVFTETHEVSHCLWQTVEPDHPLFPQPSVKELAGIRPTLREIFREVDQQIGRLMETVPEESSLLVFSLHGMTAGRGAPTFLSHLMCGAGFSDLAEMRKQTWRDRLTHSVRTTKKYTPAALKKLYYRALPKDTVRRLAAPTLLPQYDWARTRAFVIVEEHLSSIRINLKGREAQGSVEVDDYERVCREVEDWLWGLRTAAGLPLAKTVSRTATHGAEALKRRLPDIVIHWHDCAFASPLRISGSDREFFRDGERHLSQHTNEGFCILRSPKQIEIDSVLPLRSLGKLIETLVASQD